MAQSAPVQFGRYLLLERIGLGGMAEVFRAVMPGAEGFRRTFVVKRILAELSSSRDFVDMFVREARIGALLNHPNIVQMYDFGNVDGNYFLAMEYLRGRDLSAVLRRLRKLEQVCPIPVAAFVAREVADCLGYAHALTDPDGKALNIVHRDVSPSNIMCLSAGGVKLLDFGIAKAVGDAHADRTEQGVFKGKLSYMAPERIKREPIDRRADLFSLGVVLWEMLTGRRLFRGANDLDTLKNVLEAAIPVPSAVRPEVPPALDFVVMRALERDPDARYPSGQAMAEDLNEVVQETRFQPKTLQNLLRDLFGSGLQSGPVPITELTPQIFDLGSGRPTPGLGTRSAEPVAKPRSGFTARRVAASAWAVTATAALGALLFARGGGGRSFAHALPAAHAPPAAHTPPPAGVVPTASARPAASVALPERSFPPPAPKSAMSPPGEPLGPETGAVEPALADPGSLSASARSGWNGVAAAASEPPRKRPAHLRSHGDRDRITRGLSIDPFADAKTRRGR